MAAARLHQPQRATWRSQFGWSALAMVPDADVIGFALGVRYADPWGHRGAAHSLTIALLGAAVIAAIAPRFNWPRSRTWWVAAAVLTSHGLLDTLTDGGLGCALLWPFDLTRYFAPWRPIPVSPIGLAFLSPYGFFVAITEVVLFAPLLAFAVGRPRIGAAFLASWLVSGWVVASTDPIRERLVGVALREDTQYAAGFSERAFRDIAAGQPIADVRRRVGEPLGQAWMYFSPDDQPGPAIRPPCPSVYMESDRVIAEPLLARRIGEQCEQAGVRPGMSGAEVVKLLGPPKGMCWRYTRSPSLSYHRGRMVCFENDQVFDVLRRWTR
jgi:inner membrane protein